MTGLASRCEVCDVHPLWSIERIGDAVESWACGPHLSSVCMRLQRDHEVTRLVVRLHAKSVEWAQIGAALDEIS